MTAKTIDRNYFAQNPDNVDVNDWVFFKGKVGQIKSVAKRSETFLQFWVQWEGEKGLEPEMAKNLQKLDHPVAIENNQYSRFYLDSLTIDERLQQRVKLNQSVIDEYAQAYADGKQLPPIITWWDTDNDIFEKIYLVDGFHRVEAAKIAGLTELPHTQLTGSFREALLYSMSVNSTHGLRRSNADKRKAVLTLLKDDEWKTLSTRELAKIANVSHQLVHNIRQEIEFMEKALTEKQVKPEDAVKIISDENEADGEEKPKLTYSHKSLPPDVKPVKKKKGVFTIEVEAPTIEAIKQFINDEDISTAEGAILRLLELLERRTNDKG